MVVITDMGTAPATRSSYNGKEMKRVWLLNTEILCQKRGLSPVSDKNTNPKALATIGFILSVAGMVPYLQSAK